VSERPRVLIELGEELDRAARRTLKRGPRHRLTGGGVVGALGAAVAVLVAVVALAALSHHRPPAAGRAGVPPGARQLVAELAVLRRPQTAADRSLPARFVREFERMFGIMVPGLTRLVATGDLHGAGGYRIYLVVSARPPCRLTGSTANGSDGVSLVTVDSRGWDYAAGFSAAELQRFAPLPTGPGVLSSVVPDGVTRVKWTIPPGRGGADHAHTSAIWPRVRNNVAAAIPAENPSSATWYFADGRVLTSRHEPALSGCPPPSATRGANNPIVPWLKQHFAILRTTRLKRPMSLSRLMFDQAFAWRHLGLNFAQARFVQTGTGLPADKIGPGVWVVPGSRGVCVMLAPGVGGTCSGPGQPASPDSGGLRFVAGDLHARHLLYGGLVPDGNRTVAIVLANGTTRTVPVVDNLYSITVSGRAVALIDRDSAGHRERFRLSLTRYEF
jgi:hypothetical protein